MFRTSLFHTMYADLRGFVPYIAEVWNKAAFSLHTLNFYGLCCGFFHIPSPDDLCTVGVSVLQE